MRTEEPNAVALSIALAYQFFRRHSVAIPERHDADVKIEMHSIE